MKKKLLIILLLSLYNNNIYAGGGGKVLQVETKLPIYVGENAGNYIDDIDYRKQSVVSIDQNLDEYLVIPSEGMVIPIIEINENSNDYNKLINFEYINVNKYLQIGSLVYPNKKDVSYGEEGNITIMGHSSYLKSDNGRYKTHFQVIIGLDVGSEIWVFKNENNEFKRYKYIVTKSYETEDTDISILDNSDKKELTLFTCTPIGGDAWRWIIKSEFKKEYNVSASLKEAIDINLIQKIKKIENSQKRNIVINKIIYKLENYMENNHDNDDLINYIIEELKKES